VGYIYGYFKQSEGNPRPGVRLASLDEEGGSRGKSKPVILAAGVIWALIASVYIQYRLSTETAQVQVDAGDCPRLKPPASMSTC